MNRCDNSGRSNYAADGCPARGAPFLQNAWLLMLRIFRHYNLFNDYPKGKLCRKQFKEMPCCILISAWHIPEYFIHSTEVILLRRLAVSRKPEAISRLLRFACVCEISALWCGYRPGNWAARGKDRLPLPTGRETHMGLRSFIPWGPSTQTGGKLGQLKIGRVGNPTVPLSFQERRGECLFPHSRRK